MNFNLIRKINLKIIKLKYENAFSIKEIETSLLLKWMLGVLLFAFYLNFAYWTAGDFITVTAYESNSNVCWPYFLDCGKLYFFDSLPNNYSQTTFYMGLFALMLLCVYSIYKKNWISAHLIILILYLWKVFVMFFLTYSNVGNYDYYHIVLLTTLLFFPHKEFFLKVQFVLLYFLSTTVKFHETWVLGTYFSTLQNGLPIFSNYLIPLITNFVIFMEVIGSWFLLSSKKLLQKSSFAFFVLFHLYSGILVKYRYPSTALLSLLVLFGPFYKQSKVPLDKKSIFGWTFVCILFLTQFVSIIIPGDEKYTLEGNKIGLYMFEANHQCYSYQNTTRYSTNEIEENYDFSYDARVRCDPYSFWFKANQQCSKDADIKSISLKFYHSINGGPYYLIVNENNLCKLEYKFASRNKWIISPDNTTTKGGYPVKNYYT